MCGKLGEKCCCFLLVESLCACVCRCPSNLPPLRDDGACIGRGQHSQVLQREVTRDGEVGRSGRGVVVFAAAAVVVVVGGGREGGGGGEAAVVSMVVATRQQRAPFARPVNERGGAEGVCVCVCVCVCVGA